MIIPLNIQFSMTELLDYYYTLEQSYQYLKFNMIDDTKNNDKHMLKGVYGWGIQTNLENDNVPCPPYHVHKDGSDTYKDTKLMFGFAKKLKDFFPSIRQLGIAVHPPGTMISQHIDNDDYFKIHIPIKVNDNSYFIFGEDKDVMLPNKMYLVETKYMHGTHNLGDTNRVHMLFKLPRVEFEDTLKLEGSL